jgi:transcriptional regulator with XRE-family HTH domain
MALNPETQAFAGRLKLALTRSSRQIRTPTELALFFNLNHAGQQVTNQAVQKWLAGRSKPSPEKIDTLARLCHVSAQWLRYGIPDAPEVPVNAPLAASGLLPAEQLLLERLRRLSAYQRHLVMELVAQLALDWTMGRKAGAEDGEGKDAATRQSNKGGRVEGGRLGEA